MAVKKKKFITFQTVDGWYSLPVEAASKFINCEYVSLVPEAPEKIAGLIYHNGEIVTVLNTDKIISIKAKVRAISNGSCLIFSYNKDLYALLVKEEGEVVGVSRTFTDRKKRNFKKYFKIKDDKIYILEPEEIVHSIGIYDK